MDTESMSRFFAVLAIACAGAVVATVVLAITRASGRVAAATRLYDDVGRSALWVAWVVALVTTLGSLYYSEIAHYVPCKLCWYQRIAMYPLAITLLVGALRRDRSVGWYVLPPAIIGAGFALYHTQLQAFPSQHSSFCTTTEPCTIRYVWEFGFVSLPLMALSAFVLIITMTIVHHHVGAADR